MPVSSPSPPFALRRAPWAAVFGWTSLPGGLADPGLAYPAQPMIVSQPEIPTPVLLTFPFPSWATRQSEAAPPAGPARDPFKRIRS